MCEKLGQLGCTMLSKNVVNRAFVALLFSLNQISIQNHVCYVGMFNFALTEGVTYSFAGKIQYLYLLRVMQWFHMIHAKL